MGPQLLIADADRFLSDLVEQYFVAHGYSVRFVSGGAGCLTALHETHPDVLVLDTELKWGGAAGVLTVMDEEADLALIPVVLLSDTDASACSSVTEEWVTVKRGEEFEFAVLSAPDLSDKLYHSAHVVDRLPRRFHFTRLLHSIRRALATRALGNPRS